jgi:DNA polymerase-3 subunit beta
LNSTRVTFKLSKPNKAGLIIPDEMDDNEDITMLIMPVMLNDYV